MQYPDSKFETALNHGELSGQWVYTGSNNVVFSVGETALKVCLSLPNQYLENPELADELEGRTSQDIEQSNADAEALSRYFGDTILSQVAYAARGNIRGQTVAKMYDELGWPDAFQLSWDKLYEDVPLMVTEQKFYDPFINGNSEVTSFTIGKGDYNHLDSPPDRSVYEKMNTIILRGEKPKSQLDLAHIYDIQKSQSLLYYTDKLRTDPAFGDMMHGLLPKIARYTHETGGMIDIFPTTTNGLFIQDAQTGRWSAKFYEMSTSKWFGDIAFLNKSRREVLSDPHNPDLSNEALQHADMMISYMRSLNILAIESGLDPLFNIFCENGNAGLRPDCDLGPDGWWGVYERIRQMVVSMYGDKTPPSYVSICASVWKGAPSLRTPVSAREQQNETAAD